MYLSFKKIVNIAIIGIAAAAGVATADDTSASSVSLSLSLTNVVPSNKAGKQPKAGKQVKAVVGKAAKAKAIKENNSLSYSMSYGPAVDPDSAAAGLVFQVNRTTRSLRRQYGGLPIAISAAVSLAAIGEGIAAYTINLAREEAAVNGRRIITINDINTAIESDADLSWLNYRIDLTKPTLFYNSEPDIKRLVATQFSTISFESNAQILFNNFISGTFTLTVNRAGQLATGNELNFIYISEGFQDVLLRIMAPGDVNTSFAGALAVDRALQAYNSWVTV